MKVQEVVKIAEWIDGSGWSYEQIYNSMIVDVNINQEPDWEWEKNPQQEGHDFKLTVEYYPVETGDDDDDEEPLASYSIWESELP